MSGQCLPTVTRVPPFGDTDPAWKVKSREPAVIGHRAVQQGIARIDCLRGRQIESGVHPGFSICAG